MTELRSSWLSLVLVVAVFSAYPASAEDLKLSGTKHWITVASSKDNDEAIGIARLYQSQHGRVVGSKSGWLAVIIGPVDTASLKVFRKSYQDWPDIPGDARISQGENYTEIVWQPAEVPPLTEFGAGKPATVTQGDFAVTAELEVSGDNSAARLAGKNATGDLFQLSSPSDQYAEYGTAIEIARLDGKTSEPQVILTRNTGGAHCCTETWIATDHGAPGWGLIDTGMLDGDGYRLDDIDGNGVMELINYDNSFLYTFDSYAASFAPIRINKLVGGEIHDVSAEPDFKERIVQDLAGMEFLAKLDPHLWRANGFLAAWVATKVELGQGDEAWKTMLKNYDRSSDFGYQICSTGEKIEDCPQEKLKQLPFPQGLARHLKDNGYGAVPGG